MNRMDGVFMSLDRTLKRWEIALILGVLCALLCGFWLGEEQTELADRVIRFHVIANSDSPEDQALKLQVRDQVLAATEAFYPEGADLETARTALSQAGITLYPGVVGDADQAVGALISGGLSFNPDFVCNHHGEGHHHGGDCGHHEGGGCGHHEGGCGEHGCHQ